MSGIQHINETGFSVTIIDGLVIMDYPNTLFGINSGSEITPSLQKKVNRMVSKFRNDNNMKMVNCKICDTTETELLK